MPSDPDRLNAGQLGLDPSPAGEAGRCRPACVTAACHDRKDWKIDLLVRVEFPKFTILSFRSGGARSVRSALTDRSCRQGARRARDRYADRSPKLMLAPGELHRRGPR